MTLLELEKISVHYSRIQAIREMSFTVKEGRLFP